MKPIVSIILAVYNGEDYLKLAMSSVLNQTYSNLEFIIMDDCSTDSTPKIVKSFSDSRILYHRRESRVGRPYVEDVFPLTKGDFITAIGHDDIFMPQRIEKLVNKAIEYPEADTIHDKGQGIDTEGNIIDLPIQEFTLQNPCQTHEEAMVLTFAGLALNGNPLIRKTSLNNLFSGSIESKSYPNCYDASLVFFVLRNGRVAIVDEILHQFRYRENAFGNEKKPEWAKEVVPEYFRFISQQRREVSIEDIFPQINLARSCSEWKRMKSECYYQIAIYMQRSVGIGSFNKELIAQDLERSLFYNPTFSPAWHALAVLRWDMSRDYVDSAYKMSVGACKIDPINSDYLESFKKISTALGVTSNDFKIELSHFDSQQTIDHLLHRQTDWEFHGEKSAKTKKETHEIPNFDRLESSCTCLVVSDAFPPHNLNTDDYFLQNLYKFMLENNEIEVDIRFLVSDYISAGYRRFNLFPLPHPDLYRKLKLQSLHTVTEREISSITTRNINLLNMQIKLIQPDFILTWNLNNFTDKFKNEIYSLKLPMIDKNQTLEQVDIDSLDGLATLLSSNSSSSLKI